MLNPVPIFKFWMMFLFTKDLTQKIENMQRLIGNYLITTITWSALLAFSFFVSLFIHPGAAGVIVIIFFICSGQLALMVYLLIKNRQVYGSYFEEKFKFQHQHFNYGRTSRTIVPERKIEKSLLALELPVAERDFEVIKKQYRKLIRTYHPDVYKGGEEKSKEIIEAYKYLESVMK
jgi:DnaJ like chaperone protein